MEPEANVPLPKQWGNGQTAHSATVLFARHWIHFVDVTLPGVETLEPFAPFARQFVGKLENLILALSKNGFETRPALFRGRIGRSTLTLPQGDWFGRERQCLSLCLLASRTRREGLKERSGLPAIQGHHFWCRPPFSPIVLKSQQKGSIAIIPTGKIIDSAYRLNTMFPSIEGRKIAVELEVRCHYMVNTNGS